MSKYFNFKTISIILKAILYVIVVPILVVQTVDFLILNFAPKVFGENILYRDLAFEKQVGS